jgi:formiminotetrahydrofolate cyclodeaminase
MKKLLILAIISICAVGLYGKEIIGGLSLNGKAQSSEPVTLEQLARSDSTHHAMTPEEFAELAKKDPDAYRKFLQSHQAPKKRNEIDKLTNLFTNGKYE